MHWSDEIAQKIIVRRPGKEEYVCAAGISPSGSIHIGNFRDIATSWFVVKALERAGKKARLLFSWDEFDRLRKVPRNVAAVRDDYDRYIGFPYVDVPDPFDSGASSYAAYFEKEFETSMEQFCIPLDYRHQAQMYRSGAYRDYVLHCLKKRGEIFDILDTFRTQEALPGVREAYYPVSIYCPVCGRDTTKILSLNEDETVAEYECACGHHGTFDFNTDFNCKLAWKVDWPMRWLYEGGASLALLKPYYAGLPFRYGLKEIKFRPGAYVKGGMSLEIGSSRTRARAIEVGVAADYFPQGIELMDLNPTEYVFVTLYLSYHWGARYNK